MIVAWRYKRFHPAYGLGTVGFGLLVGLGVAGITGISQEIHWLYPIALLCAISLAMIRFRYYVFIVLFVFSAIAGYMRGSDVAYQLSKINKYVGQEIVLRGKIFEDPQKTVRGDTRIVLTDVVVGDTRYAGNVWVSSRTNTDYKRGDTISVRGKAKEGFGTFRLTISYASVQLVAPSDDVMVALRDQFSESLRLYVVEPSASLGVGFVVGQKSSLDPVLEEQLRIVGLTHVVVASGYNLTILVRFAKRLFEKHSKFLVTVSTVTLLAGFIAISGASPSMVRAGLVAGLSLLAWYYGRKFHPVLLLLYVASITAMYSPTYIWADLGWWLSFLAFFGVLVLSPMATNYLYKEKAPSTLVQVALESTSAQIMTLPLILLTFGSLPVLAIVANVLSAPLIPLAMLLTFLAGVSAMIVPVIAPLTGALAEVILSYFIAVIRTLSQPEWAQITFTVSWQVMVFLYGLIVGGVIVVARLTKHNFRTSSIVD